MFGVSFFVWGSKVLGIRIFFSLWRRNDKGEFMSIDCVENNLEVWVFRRKIGKYILDRFGIVGGWRLFSLGLLEIIICFLRYGEGEVFIRVEVEGYMKSVKGIFSIGGI